MIVGRIAASDVLLAVIGPTWLSGRNERGRWLDQPDDPVRFEIETAQALAKRIIPVRIDGAAAPVAHELPSTLETLAFANAPEVRMASFDIDFEERVRQLLGEPRVAFGPRSAAVICFSGGKRGAVTLSENTRVRVGSIEAFFGPVWAQVCGFFEASSSSVVAGVEGTRFLFEVRPDRSAYVAVAEGIVNCRARNGEWRDLRLQASEALRSDSSSNAWPTVATADPRELRDAAVTLDRIPNAPAYGWCCANGQISQAWQNQCAGNFSVNRGIAESACRPAERPRPRSPPAYPVR